MNESRARVGALVCVLLTILSCTSTVRAAGTVTTGKIQSGGVERSYRLFQPSGYVHGQPAALVVAMHGGWGTGEIFAAQTGFDRVAEQNGFLIVYPDGLKRVWNAGSCCGSSQKVNDVAFIRALVLQLRQKFSVDPARVYGTGFSNGAMLAHRISCEAPEVFVAIAPVAGGLMTAGCASKQPVSALMIQGYLDERIPWNGGPFQGVHRPSMKEMVIGVAARDGCSAREKITENGDGFECRTLDACAGGTEVSWCRLDKVGHQWGGGETYLRMMLGPNSDTFLTSPKIWEFFSRHPARRVQGGQHDEVAD